MPWPTVADLESLITRFRAQTLPKPEWTHQAHLAVGLWHVRHEGADAALSALRTGIRRLNDAHGTANTDSSGYHETITRAYVELVAAFLATQPPDASPADLAQALLRGPLARRDVLLDHYSKDVLFSVAARREWVPPDVRPFIPK